MTYGIARIDDSAARDLAWRLHSSLEAATGRADIKASIALAFQGSVFALVSTSRIVAGGAPPHRASGMATALILILLFVSIAASVGVVAPRLGAARRFQREYPDNCVYFGHLRLWTSPSFAARLPAVTPGSEVDMLVPQLVAMSRLAWRKHRLLQASIGLTLMALATMAPVVVAAHL